MGRMEDNGCAPVIYVQGCRQNNDNACTGCACDQGGATHIYYDACENSKAVTVIGSCEEEMQGRVLNMRAAFAPSACLPTTPAAIRTCSWTPCVLCCPRSAACSAAVI